MKEIEADRLFLRQFREPDYDDLFEYLSQLENDEFEGYPGITYENGKEHLKYRELFLQHKVMEMLFMLQVIPILMMVLCSFRCDNEAIK